MVVFNFSVLHGFRFTGALADIGLPQNDIPLALAFFNIGGELGQIAFVIVVLVFIKILSIKKEWPVIIKQIPAYVIGSLATFWMKERVVAFWN